MPALWFLLAPELLSGVGALIFCLLAVYILKAFFGADQHHGFVVRAFSWWKAPIAVVQQKAISEMAKAAVVPQQHIGAALHDTARLVDATAEQVTAQSLIVALLAQGLEHTVSTADLTATAGALTKRVGNAEAQARGIGNDVLPRIRQVETGIGNDVLPRLDTLTRELDKLRDVTVPRVRGQARTAEHGVTNLWRWVRHHGLQAGTLPFIGAVGYALARLGAGWTRCHTANDLFKRRGCNAWKDIESLLIAAAAIELPFTLELLAKVGKQVIEDSVALMDEVR